MQISIYLALTTVAYENLIHASEFCLTTLSQERKQHHEVRETEAVPCAMQRDEENSSVRDPNPLCHALSILHRLLRQKGVLLEYSSLHRAF